MELISKKWCPFWPLNQLSSFSLLEFKIFFRFRLYLIITLYFRNCLFCSRNFYNLTIPWNCFYTIYKLLIIISMKKKLYVKNPVYFKRVMIRKKTSIYYPMMPNTIFFFITLFTRPLFTYICSSIVYVWLYCFKDKTQTYNTKIGKCV